MSNISKVNVINEVNSNNFTFGDLVKGDYFLVFGDVFLKTLEPYGIDDRGQGVNIKSGITSNFESSVKVVPVDIDIKIKNIACI